MRYFLENIRMMLPPKRCLTSQAAIDINLTRGSIKSPLNDKVYLPLNSLKFSSNVDGMKNFLGVSFEISQCCLYSPGLIVLWVNKNLILQASGAESLFG